MQRRVSGSGEGGLYADTFNRQSRQDTRQPVSQPARHSMAHSSNSLIVIPLSIYVCVVAVCACVLYVLCCVVLFALPAPMSMSMPMRARAMCCGVRSWKPFARILKLKLPDLLLMMYDFRERRSLKIKTTFTAHGARCSLCMYLYVCMSIYVYILWVLVMRVFGQNKEPVAHY